MKPRHSSSSSVISLTKSFQPASFHAAAFLITVLAFGTSAPLEAASATWNGTTNATWATDTNWSAIPAPGAADTATFDNAGNANTTIDLGAGITVGNLTFSTATAAAYTIGSGGAGSQSLTLSGSGAITLSSLVANNQLINANLSLGTAAGAQAFTLANLKTATNTLTVAGAVSTAQSGLKTLTVNTAGATLISGTVTDGLGSVSLNKTGTSLLTLSGTNSYSGGTLITGLLNAANSSALGIGTVAINAAAGNQLQLGNGANVTNALSINGGGATAQGAVYVPVGNATYSGTISASTQTAGGHFATAGYVDNALTIAGNNSITSSVPITIRNGMVIFSGTQNYTGGTTMNGASFVNFKKAASMPATGTMTTIAGGTIAVNAGGAGEFTGGTGAGTIGGLLAGTGGQGAPVTWIAGTSMAIDTTNAAGTVTHAGALTPAVTVGLMKLGTGTLELTGGGTYAGTGTGGFPLIARQGTLLLNGGTHTVTGEAVIGGLFGKANGTAGLDAKLQIDSGTLAVSGYLSLGRGNGIGAVSSDLVANNGSIITAGNFSAGFNGGSALNLTKGTFTLNNTSAFTVASGAAFNFAESPGSNMTMTLNNSATVSSLGAGYKGIGNGGTGVLTLNGSSVASFGTGPTTGTGAGVLIGSTGGNGTLNINGTSTISFGGSLSVGYNTGTGSINMAGGTWNNTGEVRVGGSDINGAGPNGTGTLTISGGTANLASLTVARGNNNLNTISGSATVSGGTLNASGTILLGFAGNNNLGKLTVSGGVVNVGTAAASNLIVGQYDTSKGQLDITSGSLNLYNNTPIVLGAGNNTGTNVANQNGGTVTFYSNAGVTVGGTGRLDLQTGTAVGGGTTGISNNTYNLNGGTLIVPRVNSTVVTGTRTFNFNGGLLKPTASNATFFNLGTGNARANVRDGGAKIDTNGFNVTVAQPLLHSNLVDAAIDGGLTKSGNGVLTLNSTHTYTGPTAISAGTVSLTGSASMDSSSAVTINGSNAKLIQTSSAPVVAPVTLTQGSIDGTTSIGSLTVANLTANTLSAGNGGAATLIFNNLTFQGGATLNAAFSGTSDLQNFQTNNLTTNAAGQVVVNATNSSGVWFAGFYPVIYYTNSFTGSTSHFTVGSVPGLSSHQTVAVANVGGVIGLLVEGDSLTWTGNQSSNWSTTAIGGSFNWWYPSNSETSEFTNNNPVLFDDTAANFSVVLTSNVAPAATVFDNSVNNYTLSGTGFGITGGSLVKNGFAKLTITSTNTSTGSTTINDGILQLGDGTTDGSIATSSTITNNNGGSLIFNLVGNHTYANTIAGGNNATFTKQGAGALTLSGNNTFSGSFTLEAGILNINSANALGTAPGSLIITGGTLNNTSGAAITSGSNKPQNWNTDVTFTGSNNLAMGTGTVTLGGAGTTRTITVSAGTLGTGGIASTGFDLIKAGPGALRLSGANSVVNGTVNIQAGIIGSGSDFFANGLSGAGTFENGSTAPKWSFWTITGDQTTSTLIQNGSANGLLGIVKRGSGSWTLTNNANFATSNLAVDAGKLVLNNTGTYGATQPGGAVVTNLVSIIGNNAGENGILEINGATVNYNTMTNADGQAFRQSVAIGNNGTGTGAIRFSSGTLTTYRQLTVGSVNGSFGSFSQTGGTTNVGGFLAIGLGTGMGVFNQSAGTYNQSVFPVTNGAAAGSMGLMNLSGTASFNVNGTADNGVWVGETGTGYLNVSGTATLSFPATNNGLQLGRNAAGVGTVNLLGGNVTTPKVYKGTGAGTLNFNGGTLTANAAGATFLTGLTSAYVQSGGGTVNNGGNNVTIGQALLAPTGNGVSADGLIPSGSGFVDTPIVQITGDGTGATAVATVDASGNLTGITITNPGNGYTTPPTFALVGGGIGNTGAIGGTATLVGNSGGGMTFNGTGITTLGGVNTYAGNTTVAAGSNLALAAGAALQFSPKANGVTNKVTGAGSAFFYGDFVINTASADIANGNSWTLVNVTAKTFDPLLFNVPGFTQAADVWTRVDGNNTWTFTEATGVLSLAVTAPSGYASWVAGYTWPLGADQTRTGDPDGDSFTNLQEFLFGTSPVAGNGSLATSTSAGGVITIRWNQLVTGGTYQLLESATLANPWTPSGTTPTNDGAAAGNYQPRKADVTIGAGNKFFRVEGVEN